MNRLFFLVIILCIASSGHAQKKVMDGCTDQMSSKVRLRDFMINVNHWLVPNDSCICLTWTPGYITRDEECWKPMAVSMKLPLSVTEAWVIDDFYTNCIFFVDTTGYIMIQSARSVCSLTVDSAVVINMNDLPSRNHQLHVELDLFRRKRDTDRCYYYARKDCASLFFYNIPDKDVANIIRSLDVLNCMERVK